MTNKQDDIWVIKKWVYIWKNKGSDDRLIHKYPELKNLSYSCAWCCKYNEFYQCDKECPLVKINNWCKDPDSMYKRWNYTKTTQTAKAVLDTCIKAIKTVREYKDFTFIDKLLEG